MNAPSQDSRSQKIARRGFRFIRSKPQLTFGTLLVAEATAKELAPLNLSDALDL